MNAIAMPPVDAGVIARRDEIIAALRAAIGDEHVIVSEDERRAYETDALTAYRAVPLAVVLPGSTEEVAAVLKVLSAAKVKVVARGAGTSLSGGALPSPDSVVVGLARLNRILAIDYDNRVARVLRTSPTDYTRPIVEAWRAEELDAPPEIIDLSKQPELTVAKAIASLAVA